MRFNLIFFMSLASIASIGSPIPDSLLTNLPRQLQQCPHLVERLKKFENCDVPLTLNAQHVKEALPYMCMLTLNTILDICRENGSRLWHSFETRYKTHVNTTICPFNYTTKSRHLTMDVNKAAEYFRNRNKCEAVCMYSNQTVDDCVVMALLDEEVDRLNEKREEGRKQTVPRDPQSPIHQDTPPNAAKQIVYDLRQKAGKAHAAMFETKSGDPLPSHVETVSKNESKAAVKMETTSECETKDKEEKTNNGKIIAEPKPDISANSKGMNYSNTVNSDTIKTPGNDVSNKVKANVDDTKNSKIDDNILKSNNKEVKTNIGQDGLNLGKIDFAETEMPITKEVNEPNIISPSSVKKDYTYGSTIKSSADEGEDDDNNEEIPDNPPLQDVLPDREYESGKVPNPKELYNADGLFQAEDSHFSAYFLMTISIIIIGYIIYHNKNKIVAYALEGRRGRNGRRRPTSASYRKLDCNLEEAIASNPSHTSVTNVVY